MKSTIKKEELVKKFVDEDNERDYLTEQVQGQKLKNKALQQNVIRFAKTTPRKRQETRKPRRENREDLRAECSRKQTRSFEYI